jgi:hypothetical protein
VRNALSAALSKESMEAFKDGKGVETQLSLGYKYRRL